MLRSGGWSAVGTGSRGTECMRIDDHHVAVRWFSDNQPATGQLPRIAAYLKACGCKVEREDLRLVVSYGDTGGEA
jgi:hypothetical protein